MNPYDAYELVVGLEVHCQLLTRSKIFCGCSTTYGAPPNAHTCPICLGHPGTLPVLNRAVVELAVRLGLALGCTIRSPSVFARKQYFYPDLPNGYQTTQFEAPICEGGAVSYVQENGTTGRVNLVRIHLEEDAGKTSHPEGAGHSLVDFNRAGVPLVEMVSHPDLRSADEAVAYLKALHGVVVALGVSDGNMQEGSFRADANVSVRKRGDTKLGTRVELKNINSFRFVHMAITHEFRRQVDLLEEGSAVVQQTRGFDAEKNDSYAMRGKEDAHDYRYFPCPDLPPLVVDEAWLERIRATVKELPQARAARIAALGVPAADARTLTEDPAVADYFERALAVHPGARSVANWVLNEVLRDVKEVPGGVGAFGMAPETLARVVAAVDGGKITGKMAKELYAALRDTGRADVDAVMKERGLVVEDNPEALAAAVDAVVAANAGEFEKLKAGKDALMGFFVGQVMKKMGGRADPKAVNAAMRQRTGRG